MKKNFAFMVYAILFIINSITLKSYAQTLSYGEVQVKTVGELINAVNGGNPGDLILIFPGVYELESRQGNKNCKSRRIHISSICGF